MKNQTAEHFKRINVFVSYAKILNNMSAKSGNGLFRREEDPMANFKLEN